MAGLKAEREGAGIDTGVCPSIIGQLSTVGPEYGGDDEAWRLLGFWAAFLRGPLYPRREAT